MKKGGPRAYVSDTCGTLYKSPQKPRGPHTIPRKNRQDENSNSTLKIEIKNRKKTHTSKREERGKTFKSGKEAIESKKSRKDTQENAQFFADFRLARFARVVEQRQKQKNKHMHSTTKDTREAKKETITGGHS